VPETEIQLKLVANNPGWPSNSYLCSYIVACFISLLTFLHCKSLHCINCVATRNLARGYVDLLKSCFLKNSLYWTWTWEDSQRWFKVPTPIVHWSHICRTKNFFTWYFQPLLEIKFYCFFVCGQRERWLLFMLNLRDLLAKLYDLWPEM